MEIWELELNGKRIRIENPTPTYSFGLLGDVGTFNALSTREIKIPRNPVSDVFFGFAGNPNVFSDFQKTTPIAKVLYNNQAVVSNALVTNFEPRAREYRLILASNNQALIDLLNSNIGDLDYSDLIHEPTPANIAAGLIADPEVAPYVYAHASYAPNLLIPDASLLPAISFATILDRLLTEAGIAIYDASAVQFRDTQVFKRSFFQIGTAKDFVPDGETLTSSGTTELIFTPATFTLTINQSGDVVGSRVTIGTYNITITAPVTALSISFTIEGATPTRLVQDRGGVLTIIGTVAGFANILDLQVGDFFYFEALATLPDVGTTIGVTSLTVSENIVTGGLLLGPSLPSIKQIEFLKFLTNQFGLFADFNPETGVLFLTDYKKYNTLWESGEFIDLTSRLCNPMELDLDTDGGFAQSNTISFANKLPARPTDGQGSWTFENKFTPVERSYYRAPFGIGATVRYNYTGAGSVPLFIDTCTAPYVEAKEGGDLVRKEIEAMYVLIDKYYTPTADYVNYITNGIDDPNLATPMSTSFAWAIRTFGAPFQAVLGTYQTITVDSKLEFTDVEELFSFTERKPVFTNLRWLNGVFKLNQISKFRPNGITRIELTRINPGPLRLAPLGTMFQGSEDELVLANYIYTLIVKNTANQFTADLPQADSAKQLLYTANGLESANGGQYMLYASPTSVPVRTYTMAVFAFIKPTLADQCLFSYLVTATGDAAIKITSAGDISIYTRDAFDAPSGLTWTPPAGFFNTPHLYAATFESGSKFMKLLIDGVQVAQTVLFSVNAATPTLTFSLGADVDENDACSIGTWFRFAMLAQKVVSTAELLTLATRYLASNPLIPVHSYFGGTPSAVITSGAVSSLGNMQGPLAAFNQATPANRPTLGANGGIAFGANLRLTQVSNVPTTYTKFTLCMWVYLPSPFTPVTPDAVFFTDYFPKTVPAPTRFTGLWWGVRVLGGNSGFSYVVRDANGVGVGLTTVGAMPSATFNTMYGNKWTFTGMALDGSSLKIYVGDAIFSITHTGNGVEIGNAGAANLGSYLASSYLPAGTEIQAPRLFYGQALTAQQLTAIKTHDQETLTHLA